MIGDFRVGTETVMEINPRVRPPQDDTLKITVHYDNDRGLSVLITEYQVRALRTYLNMEHVPPFTADCGPTSLRVVQESDGCTWVRVYRRTGASKLTFLSDHETGQLYDWLGLALKGEWDGWKIG